MAAYAAVSLLFALIPLAYSASVGIVAPLNAACITSFDPTVDYFPSAQRLSVLATDTSGSATSSVREGAHLACDEGQ